MATMQLFWIGVLTFVFCLLWAWAYGFSRRAVALSSLFFAFIFTILLSV